MKSRSIIPSVNFHLWEPCNMRCKFCFATFQDVKKQILPKGHLPKEDAINVIERIAEFGFEKITFAGGEPTLCPWLPELIQTAKERGMTTMIVTNGTQLTNGFLKQMSYNLDWIALSIDSLASECNLTSGRAITGKKPIEESVYMELINRIKLANIRLKINTVVHTHNFSEDMNDFITTADPLRWKVLQVLPIDGQNSKSVDPFLINEDQFESFLKIHQKQKSLIPESNRDIKGSYVMIDPAGRFFQNIENQYRYSEPILLNGIYSAYNEMNYKIELFQKRGGIYEWK